MRGRLPDISPSSGAQARHLPPKGKAFPGGVGWGWFKKESELMEETNMEDNKSTTVKKTVKSGITFGSALAMVISYTTWKSVGWAIFHGLLSWVYVIYFLLRY